MKASITADAALEDLLAALAAGQPGASVHAARVAALAAAIARALRMPEDAVATIRRGALLHDLGKLVLPEAIVRYAGLPKSWESP